MGIFLNDYTELSEVYNNYLFYRGCREESYKKVDIMLLLVRYDDRGGSLNKLEGSLPFPSECIATSKHNMSSVVTCSALLNPGRYYSMGKNETLFL